MEVKEGLEPESESNTIASISHPSFFQNYETIFGLTGTIGNEIEREEILNIYKLDSFDAPPNFSSKRKIYEPILFENKNIKEENIINQVRKMISQGRPVLVLLLTIENSINFSNKLKYEGINNLILNDIQKEKEDYIIYFAGKPRSVVVATNAAGRGTDIILSEEALNFGGLHVIMGFYPENNRVEFQGIGRAARQGQIGSAQIMFSKDEILFRENKRNISINSVEDAKSFRNEKLKFDSILRIKSSHYEINVYNNNLKLFFEKLAEIKNLLNNEKFRIIVDNICLKNDINYNYEEFSQKLIEDFRVDWAEYFDGICEKKKTKPNNFENFMEEYKWKSLNSKNFNEFSELIKNKIINK